jgi:hypothetical protein
MIYKNNSITTVLLNGVLINKLEEIQYFHLKSEICKYKNTENSFRFPLKDIKVN